MLDIRTVFAAVGRAIQAQPVVALLSAALLVFIAIGGAAQIQSVTGNQAFVGDNPTL